MDGIAGKPCHTASFPASVPRDQLIPAVLAAAGDGGGDHAVFRDAFGKGAEFRVVAELERMPLEGVQLVDGDLRHLFPPVVF